MSDPELKFLWRLFQLGLFDDQTKKAIEWVESMYNLTLDLPPKIEATLSAYVGSGDRRELLKLAQIAVEGFLFNVEHGTRLVALLVAEGSITLEHAFNLISFDGVNTDGLSESVHHLGDVIWLLKQDADLGVIAPTEDSQFDEALKLIAREGAPPLEL